MSHGRDSWLSGHTPKKGKLIVFAHFMYGRPSFGLGWALPGLAWALSDLIGASGT